MGRKQIEKHTWGIENAKMNSFCKPHLFSIGYEIFYVSEFCCDDKNAREVRVCVSTGGVEGRAAISIQVK
eukprot:CAMPEP_0167815944 /NCGR_PEP_ID=MMETSP0112_2-20121227/3310_1 /TAXON_ID=91324 /ORGANISM="Lotharella globosa, Strain CCCM811" /LENGTH=69 /DNA_ID=CAMNT_0007715433 /DNA_START=63 /DNA_END=269 /DNA_ORIENTATION=-